MAYPEGQGPVLAHMGPPQALYQLDQPQPQILITVPRGKIDQGHRIYPKRTTVRKYQVPRKRAHRGATIRNALHGR